VDQCGQQREEQAALHASLAIAPEEEDPVSHRVDELIAHEKAELAAKPKGTKTAADELLELSELSSKAGSNYLASAHTRRAGYLWPSAGKFDSNLRAQEMNQLSTASRAIQSEGGVRAAVRFLTDHPFSLAQAPFGAACATTHAFAGNQVGSHDHSLPHSLRDTQRAEAEALPEIGADVKSVFVTSGEMPSTYEAAMSHRSAAQSGYPYLHAKEWPVYGLDPARRAGYGAQGLLGPMGYHPY